ncbi:MAG: ankyrin repeat domain-containing protein [Gammaproteobacteria bacterium]|nr:ankyrin repeat domain-containing protein [Gammaproteobacteria bacterium]
MRTEFRIGLIAVCLSLCTCLFAQEETEEQAPEGDVWTAAAEGDIETLKALVEAGADLNSARSTTETELPLMLAVRERQSETIKWLAENGADVNKRDINGNTAIISAAFFGFPKVFQLLVDSGADMALQNYEGQSAMEMLEVAWEITNYIANDMLEIGLEQEAVEAGRMQIRRGLAKTNVSIAVEIGDAELVMEHIKKGVDVNTADAGGTSLLMAATVSNNVDIAKFLVDAGAELDNRHPATGATALLAAAFLGLDETAKVLIDAGADPTIADYQGSTTMDMLTLSYGETDYVASLIGIALKSEEELTASREAIGKMLESVEGSDEAEESGESEE